MSFEGYDEELANEIYAMENGLDPDEDFDLFDDGPYYPEERDPRLWMTDEEYLEYLEEMEELDNV